MATTASPHANFANAQTCRLMSSQTFRMRLVDLVAMPGGPHPIPFRTRSLSPPGPMVLRLKARESRSPPGLHEARMHAYVQRTLNHNDGFGRDVPAATHCGRLRMPDSKFAAGWSSPVARQAHNLKVAGSNPTPAPKIEKASPATARPFAFVCRFRTVDAFFGGRFALRPLSKNSSTDTPNGE